MMKTVIMAILIVFMAIPAFGEGRLVKDAGKNAIQSFCPNGTLSEILTVASTWKDLTGRLYWNVYVPVVTTCKFRLTPTQAKGAYPQLTIPAATQYGLGVNYASDGTLPSGFLNFSGCTNGEYQAQ